MRQHGEVVINNRLARVEGTAAWKTFYLKDVKTSEVVFKRNFYKEQFNELWLDPECLPWLEGILEDAMVRKLEGAVPMPDIDPASYVEVQALADVLSGGADPGDIEEE